MNTQDRNLMVMEMAGIDCSSRARELSTTLRNSSLYIESMLRLKQASLTGLPSLMKEYSDLRDLDFDISTMVDYAALETHVLEHSMHSLDVWWTNPFEAESQKDGPSSIGQLLIKHNEDYMTIDELLEDASISNEEKHKAVEDRIDTWHRDEADRMVLLLNEMKSKDRRVLFTKSLTYLFSLILLLFGNSLAIYTLSNSMLREFMKTPDWSYLSSYVAFIPTLAAALFDIIFAISMSIKTRRDDGLDYISNYVRGKLYRNLRRLRKLSERLMSDIDEHIVLRTPMGRNSIRDYVFVESEDITRLRNVPTKERGGFVDTLFIASCWLFFFILTFCVVVIVIDLQKGVAI